ncbi:hypothetical protein PHMEG_0001482 [Phytophthora megakarya]|uniref:Eukaryotic/viral aspartic protease n=1 Tax=Phytophthora megakarya TaxID=4795 RepID=A0A225X347_9STRA|nr:hypothetical protein PHMEG_0001482 [Phytophthora megakarya]
MSSTDTGTPDNEKQLVPNVRSEASQASGVDDPRSRARGASRFHKQTASRSGLSATPPSYGMFPSEVSLNDWTAADAGTALLKWKKKLREAFGIEEIASGRQVIARQAA